MAAKQRPFPDKKMDRLPYFMTGRLPELTAVSLITRSVPPASKVMEVVEWGKMIFDSVTVANRRRKYDAVYALIPADQRLSRSSESR